MIPNRQKSRSVRVVKTAFADQVPDIIAAQIATLTQQAAMHTDEMIIDKILEDIRNGISVEELPDRQYFQNSFLAQRATTPQVKVDTESENLYLMGVGIPGREELHLQRVPMINKHNEVVGYDLQTTNKIQYDTVISYTRIGWDELKEAEDETARVDEHTKALICSYYKLPAHDGFYTSIRLSTPTLTLEDIYAIASYVEANQG